MKAKTKKELILGIPFWGGLVWLGLTYGWQLPVALFLVVLGVLLQHHNSEHHNKF